MQRHLFQRGAVIVASMAVWGGVFAQGTAAPSPSVPATAPTMTPALPPLAAPSVPPATTPVAPPAASLPAAPTLTPALPPLAPSVPPATTQPTQPLSNSNPASQPGYGGQGYAPGAAAPMTSGAAQPAPDPRALSRSDSAPTAFRALDPMNRGYVTRADTDKISGFMGFDSADADRDGRLTPDEFYNAWKFFAQ
jgi:hypothetical protein